MAQPSPGDRVRVVTRDNSFEGRMMPDTPDILSIKLDNGYNIGIAKESIRELNILENYAQQTPVYSLQQNPDLPQVSILHTGGTIASKVDYVTGGVISRFSPEELIAQFPELHKLANISSRLVRNMWSDDIRLGHINSIAQEIIKEVEMGVTGIIVSMGTDNLCSVAAGLAFVLQDLPIPVLLVGAQRSSDRGSSDAAINLIAAARFITTTDFAGVSICMHEGTNDTSCLVLSPTQSMKLHSSARGAFQPINQSPFARVSENDVTFLRTDYTKRSNAKPQSRLFNEKLHIGILKSHVHMYASEFLAYEGFDGLIIEGTGLGHVPLGVFDTLTEEHKKIERALHDLVEQETIVVMTTQTIFGTVNHNVYERGRNLKKLGILGCQTDVPVHTAFMKLAWLLSHYSKEETKNKYHENICGELTARRTHVP